MSQMRELSDQYLTSSQNQPTRGLPHLIGEGEASALHRLLPPCIDEVGVDLCHYL